jgi:Holliday junction resolvase-like predicted endonuclease
VTGVKLIKDTNRKGDFAEYYAVTWLWDNGYEVFQNAGCTGPIDMIAVDKKGETLFIDVKTIHPNNNNDKNPNCKKTRTKKQQQLGVQLLGFNPETRGLHFIDHKI